MHGPPLFCCPRCQGPLSPQPETWSCADCASDYPLRHGFIDFRTGKASDVDAQADSKLAEFLASREASCTFAELRAYYYSLKPEASDELHRRHESHFQAEAVRAKRVVQQLSEGPLLDLGCGAGQYLLAAARSGIETVGVDASLCQLILARRLLADQGFNGQLALANVEQLPFPSRTFRSAVATDVLEHLHDPNLFLAETARVLAPQGALWLTTPNRFSLTPEPHVGLWGAGWLPHSLAVRYVRARTGIDYNSIRLMSLRDLRLILERSFPAVEISLPTLAASEIDAFSPLKRMLARAYRTVSRIGPLRPALLRVTPYFEATCRKQEPPPS
ncbi:MAG: class I SAM-dependent methyltransferase [Acidobacteria bacterium]|nr:class I SAM-dependent methyltransferase [Acidobacteriota bacterium]MDA1237095.1 class I SAM-dependent methyltransferase [Acidobacteriota bacterium]